jgi:ATP-dependent DNA helicase, RecQ family
MNASALDLLQSVFGYPSFRGQQQAVVEHLSEGGDALVLMPTGGGKSLCYQIPALLRQGTGIVVSPLIALMQDQVDALREAGVAAAYLNSSLGAEEQREVERQLLAGELNLLYVAPERLLTQRFLGQLERTEVALFAIDEAHCVSQWGHDFRPEYRELAILHQRFPQVPRIALTATADPRTREEIVERLSLQDARQFVSSFDRPNIGYRVGLRHNAKRQLTEFLQGHQGESGIVYCLSRKKVDDTAEWLAEAGVEALPYHAGLDAPTRAKNQKRFLREDGVVMVATVAFGMGIDKPDVRFVAHLDLPRSIEGYYQETGRAGRDSLPAEAWMIYGLSDVVTMSQMIAQSESPTSASGSSGRSWNRCWPMPKPPVAAVSCCWARSAKPIPAPAAIATTASRRRRPGTPPCRRRKRCPPSIAVGSASAPVTSSTSCAARKPNAYSACIIIS